MQRNSKRTILNVHILRQNINNYITHLDFLCFENKKKKKNYKINLWFATTCVGLTKFTLLF